MTKSDSSAEGIRHTLAEYCQAIDDGRADEWSDLFQPETTFIVDGLGAFSGRDSARTFVEGSLDALAARGISGTKHLTINTVLAIDGQQATAVSDFALMVPGAGMFTAIALGRYTDELIYEGPLALSGSANLVVQR